MKAIIRGLCVAAGLTLANFGWALFDASATWGDAFERSFFQFGAIVTLLMVQKFLPGRD
jgi:hypothetical protein